MSILFFAFITFFYGISHKIGEIFMIKVGIIGAMDVEVEGFCHHMTGVILHQLCGLDFLDA